MPEPARYPMAVHRRTNTLADNEPYARTRAIVTETPPPDVNDDIRLRHANPALHRRVKLR